MTTDTPNCAGCGEPLLLKNAWMYDGCPCNSPSGVNDDNLRRWKLLWQLQQQGARRYEQAERELAAAQERNERLCEALQRLRLGEWYVTADNVRANAAEVMRIAREALAANAGDKS